VLPLADGEEILTVAFAADETKLACIKKRGASYEMVIFAMDTSSDLLSFQASHVITGMPVDTKIVFSHSNSSLLVLSYWNADFSMPAGTWVAEIPELGGKAGIVVTKIDGELRIAVL
jgi:hypothetical protein